MLPPTGRRAWGTCMALAAIGGSALLYVLAVARSPGPPFQLSLDWYAHYYPIMVTAVRALGEGGQGLLWNPFQNCGQPFFGISSNGLLAPASSLFLLLPPTVALPAVAGTHLLIAGVSAYALGRALLVPPVAAVAGAIAFQIGNATLGSLGWGPLVSGAWVWIPGALAFGERLLRAPSARGAVGLGVVLSMALLSGFPQYVIFAYQLLALRIAWEAWFRPAAVVAALPALGGGLVLPLLLTAMHLLPGTETALHSVRGAALDDASLAHTGFLTWDAFRRGVASGQLYFNPILTLPAMVALAGVTRRSHWRPYGFYLLAGAVYAALAFGPATPLYTLYTSLPMGSSFRDPYRFMVVPNLCCTALIAIGASVLGRDEAAGGIRQRRLLAAAAAAVGFVMVRMLAGSWPSSLVTALAAIAVAAYVAGAWLPRIGVLAIAAAVALQVWSMQWTGAVRIAPDDDFLYTHAEVLGALRARMTPHDRVYIAGARARRGDPYSLFRLQPKTASLLRLRAINDYEPQPDRRYSELLVMLRSGRPMRTLNDVYYGRAWLEPSFSRTLLNHTAARYLAVQTEIDTTAKLFAPPLPMILSDRGVRVYENAAALPRAYVVPGVEVEPDAAALLARLASPDHDPRQIALVDALPPSRSAGVAVAEEPAGTVEFVRDDPEYLVVRARAVSGGFLILADLFAPGWLAEVNGQPAPILRANYAFRAVELPPGESTVSFRYRPRSVFIGAGISAATMAVMAAVAMARRRRS